MQGWNSRQLRCGQHQANHDYRAAPVIVPRLVLTATKWTNVLRMDGGQWMRPTMDATHACTVRGLFRCQSETHDEWPWAVRPCIWTPTRRGPFECCAFASVQERSMAWPPALLLLPRLPSSYTLGVQSSTLRCDYCDDLTPVLNTRYTSRWVHRMDVHDARRISCAWCKPDVHVAQGIRHAEEIPPVFNAHEPASKWKAARADLDAWYVSNP
jgi:hypothetical protein